MHSLAVLQPIDYLAVGHVTRDSTAQGSVLGGSVSFAGLTARAMGLRVGIVTSFQEGLSLPELDGIQVVAQPCSSTTTFENVYSPSGRIQVVHHPADSLNLSHIPEVWRRTPIIHLAPVAQEVDPGLVNSFPDTFTCLTPQGWLRTWDGQGHVHASEWPEASFVLQKAAAAVFSLEDVENMENRIEEMLSSIRILAVTEGDAGARVYWNGDLRRFRPPQVQELDATGAGDIFAAAFFIRLHATHDPWEAARFATLLAAASVTRPGLAGIPTSSEVQSSLMEIIQN